jgi:hypothetical protein
VISAHLLQSPSSDEEDSEDGYEDPQDFVNFYETEDGTRIEVKQKRAIIGEEIKREKGGRMYRIITRNYMAEGYDGFGAFKGHKFVIDDDNGQIMSSIVRSFLLGRSTWCFSMIDRLTRLISFLQAPHTSSDTNNYVTSTNVTCLRIVTRFYLVTGLALHPTILRDLP